MSKLKILELDIETAPHTSYTWGTFQQNIAPSQIKEHGRTICWTGKWYGADRLYYRDERKGHREMIEAVHSLMSEADIYVTYNGASFDVPMLNNAFLQYDLKPLPPTKHVDLYLAVRKKFRLASNKLEYVVQYLGIGAKVEHKGFPLWRGCMAGDPASWRVMERYNKHDVVILDKVYERLRPWVPNHPDVKPDERYVHCHNCGSTNVTKRGERHTKEFTIERFQCKDCGAWPDGKRTRRTKKAA